MRRSIISFYPSSFYCEDAEDDPTFFAASAARRTVRGPDGRLGHGAIVASGAVVMKDVDPLMIVAGCPAMPLQTRILRR
ncbi:hypothetical protein H5395_05295 [Paracoccus sp. MC1854]|uniref:hypothetical protein n=1 Tax=Paracoccus sp. MC1854 TaxID=2760306 RepID=UPI00160169DC|nr:hypothetical protein [Paracoccus sp. MC1854]MBB1490952.1 hypothetical protein [Paracoccus sp. MC1854]